MKCEIKRKIPLMLTCLAFVMFTNYNASSQVTGQNLVENGGFGELDGWQIEGYLWSPQTGGVSGGYISFQQYAEQLIATKPGVTYQLSFWTQSSTPLIQVNWGTENLGLFPMTSGLQGWEMNQLDVTAQATSTLLDFSCSDPYAFCDLDDVAVYAVIPEPSPEALPFFSAFVLLILCYKTTRGMNHDSVPAKAA